MLPFLRIGPLLVQTPVLALLTGLWISTALIEREALHLKLNAGTILNMIFYGLLGGLIGARLIHVSEHLHVYLSSPGSLFSLNTSTLNPLGGLIIGVTVALLIGRRQALPFRPALDALAPGLAVLMIAIGVANILSGNAYGSPTHLPWGIYLWGENRHPTQIYETLTALAIFVLWKANSTGSQGPGIRFLQVTALSAGARILLEAFRGDSLIWPGGYRAAQVVGLMILAITIQLARQWLKVEKRKKVERLCLINGTSNSTTERR